MFQNKSTVLLLPGLTGGHPPITDRVFPKIKILNPNFDNIVCIITKYFQQIDNKINTHDTLHSLQITHLPGCRYVASPARKEISSEACQERARFQQHRDASCHQVFFLQGKTPKEIHAILTETLAFFPFLVRIRTYQHPCKSLYKFISFVALTLQIIM